MRPILRWSLGVFSLGALMIMAPDEARACSCRLPPDAKAAAPYASDIFEAVPVGAPVPGPPEQLPREITYTFDVGRVMKGTAAGIVKVTTNLSSAACGRTYEAGQTYLLYAMRGEKGLRDGLCSFTATKSKAADRGDYTYWGDGPPPASARAGADEATTPAPDGAPSTQGDPTKSKPSPTNEPSPSAANDDPLSASAGDAGLASAKGCTVAAASTEDPPGAGLMGMLLGLLALRRRRGA